MQLEKMVRRAVADVNQGFVRYQGVLMPRRFRVTLTDETSSAADLLPAVNVAFEIREERIKCISISIESGEGQRSIKSTFLHELNIDKLGIEGASTLAFELKTPDGEEVVPAQLQVGRAAARKLADGVNRLSVRELMHIGYHYSNPSNSKAPTQAVQVAMGYGSRHTAIRRIKEARDKGWVLPVESSANEILAHFQEIRRRMDEKN